MTQLDLVHKLLREADLPTEKHIALIEAVGKLQIDNYLEGSKMSREIWQN